MVQQTTSVNKLGPRQNGQLTVDDVSKYVFLTEMWLQWNVTPIPMKFVPNVLTDNMSALVEAMAWHWRGDKPLPESMVTEITEAI